jgi:dihydroneopterin aldolase
MGLCDFFYYKSTIMSYSTSIVINNLRIYAYHGVGEQEQCVGNDFELNIRVGYDATKAMTSDTIEDAVSYADIVEIAKRVMATPSRLLEHVTKRLADAIIAQYPAITSLEITLLKVTPPIPADLDSAGFTYTWSK